MYDSDKTCSPWLITIIIINHLLVKRRFALNVDIVLSSYLRYKNPTPRNLINYHLVSRSKIKAYGFILTNFYNRTKNFLYLHKIKIHTNTRISFTLSSNWWYRVFSEHVRFSKQRFSERFPTITCLTLFRGVPDLFFFYEKDKGIFWMRQRVSE